MRLASGDRVKLEKHLYYCVRQFRGLEDQLLASVVGAEQPALEKTKNDLVQVGSVTRLEKEKRVFI